MKQRFQQQWLKLSTKLDGMTLRERVMIFATVVAGMLFLIYVVSVQPLLSRQKVLNQQIKTQQKQIAGIEMDIAARAQGFVLDPDAETRARLKTVRQEIDTTSAGLLAVQKGLVAPDKIAPLLGHLLRGNGKLKLISLKTLPVTGLNEAAHAKAQTARPKAEVAQQKAEAAAAAVVAAAASGIVGKPKTVVQVKPRELLYRHGVEIVLQGTYLDMISYMDALEALPLQLFWGKAQLDAQQYPNSRLTLTLYTLSLDQKWMKL